MTPRLSFFVIFLTFENKTISVTVAESQLWDDKNRVALYFLWEIKLENARPKIAQSVTLFAGI